MVGWRRATACSAADDILVAKVFCCVDAHVASTAAIAAAAAAAAAEVEETDLLSETNNYCCLRVDLYNYTSTATTVGRSQQIEVTLYDAQRHARS
jgi:hypothetical protein